MGASSGARLIYTAITSLDGYIADSEGDFGWAAPDDELHAFVNDLERPIGTYLYGRRMYEVMVYWETAPAEAGAPEVELDYARLWRAADKIVYSTTLPAPRSERTAIERSFDPEGVRALKAAADRDLSVSGPNLAGHAFRAGLVDEIRLLVTPVLAGGGTAALPPGLRTRLELVEERRFRNGVVYVCYTFGGEL
ncbi:MAG TPA: dihydrofolate reductase family protein [Actinomycetota bacterium]|nr:dihydrofolate reductase family protein [Actinomycetota bacterium]